MEEQFLTQKQFKIIKTTYSLLQVTFILLIVSMLGAFGFIISSAFMQSYLPAEILLAVSLAFIVELVIFYLLVFSKHVSRKRIISVTLLINAILFSGLRIYGSVFTSSAGNSLLLYTISEILNILTAIIFIYLAVMLLQKTREKQAKHFAIKPLFIFYIVAIYVDSYILFFHNFNPAFLIGSIIGGFILILLLLPQYVLYKSLTDDIFYQNFLVAYPLIAINSYQAMQASKTRQASNGYCTKCGAPLKPGAEFCTICGTKKAS